MPRLFGWCGCLWVDSRWTLTATTQHCIWEAKRSWIKAVTQEMPIVSERSLLSWVPDFGKGPCCRSRKDEYHYHLASAKGCAWS